MVDSKKVGIESDNALDTVIQRSLERDARALPSFGTVPNAQLMAKLSSHSMSKGIFASFGGKLALFVTGVALIGTGTYLIPKLTGKPEMMGTTQPWMIGHPRVAPQSSVQPAVSTVDDRSSTLPETNVEGAQLEASKSSSTQTVVQTPKVSSSVKRPSPKISIDEGDDKNAPKIIDKGYGPPLK